MLWMVLMERSSWVASFGLKCPVQGLQEDVADVVAHEEVVDTEAIVGAAAIVVTAVVDMEVIVVVAVTVGVEEDAAVAEDTETVVEVAAVTVEDEEVMTAVRIRDGIKSFPNFVLWPLQL